jgi:hypothetical protein
MSKAIAMQALAIVKCQSRSVMASGGGGAAGTGAVNPSSRARYTGRYINISIFTYQKRKFAYPVFDTVTLSVHRESRLTVCRRLRVQILFEPFWNPDQNWDVLVCTGMYWDVLVCTGVYWYILICTGMYLLYWYGYESFGMNLYVLVHKSMYMYILVYNGMYCA